MTELQPWSSSSHNVIDLETDWNALLEYGLVKSCSYLVRKSGSYYEGILGGSTSPGTIAYGGPDDNGTTSGLDAPDVINACLGAGTGTVLLLDSTYTIDSSITLGAGDHLVGESVTGTVLDSTITDSSDVITANAGNDDGTAYNNVLVANLKIEGVGTEGDGIYYEFCRTNQSQIRNVWIDGCGDNGIHLHHCWSSQIVNCYLVNNTDSGIQFADRCHNAETWGLLCDTNAYGSYQPYGSGTKITHHGGTFQNNTTNDLYLCSTQPICYDSYMENSNAITMVRIGDNSNRCFGPVLDSCYINGGTNTASGIYTYYADHGSFQRNTIIDTNVLFNFNSTSTAMTWRNNRLSSWTSATDAGNSGLGALVPYDTVPFVDGSDPQDEGYLINAGGEYARTYFTVPDDLYRIVRLVIWAETEVLEADAMRLEISAQSGQPGASANGESIAIADKPSFHTNFAANYCIAWEIDSADDSDLDDFRPGECCWLKVLHEAAGGDDCATQAYFRFVEIKGY